MDVLDLMATLGLDSSGYEKGLSGALGTAKSIGGKIANGIGVISKVSAAALGTAATGVAALTKKSIDAYANYEQLIGGVQKLYGNMGQSLEEYAKAQGKTVNEVKDEWQKLEDAQNLVAKNASEAWKTAGMSVNEYMENATGFSAALIKSLGGDTVKAAEMTDVAMRAISDNVNTFGSDMESVTNAFMGFSKANYTMLDNLKLGYGGTKEGMEQLIADANEYAKSIGKAGDLSIDSFADIVQAIELVQEKTSVANTTSREALSTIEGSLSAVKASWENVITAMSGGGDMGKAFEGLSTALFGEVDKTGEEVGGLINNLIPRIQTALEGIGQFLQEGIPKLAERIPGAFSDMLPTLIDSAQALVNGLVGTLTGLLSDGKFINDIVKGVTDTFNSLISTVSENLPKIIDTISDQLPTIIDGIKTALNTVITALSSGGLIDSITGLLTDNVPYLIEAFVDVMTTLAGHIDEIILPIVNAIPDFIDGITGAFGDNIDMFVRALVGSVTQIASQLPILIPKIVDALTKLIVAISKVFPTLIETELLYMPDIVSAVVSSLVQAIPILVPAIIEVLAQVFPILLKELILYIPLLIDGLVRGLIDGIVKTDWAQVWQNLVDAFKDFFGIHSPSTLFADFGLNMIQGLADGLINNIKLVIDKILEIKNNIEENFKGIIDNALQWGADLVGQFAKGIKDHIGDVKDGINAVAEKVSSHIHFSKPDEGPLADFDTYAPDMMKLFAKGITDNADLVSSAMNNSFGVPDLEGLTAPVEGSQLALAGGGTAETNTNLTIPIYLGNELLDTVVLKAIDKNNYRTGGR